jgi:predicted amidohydrolase YtcJ
MNRRQLLTTMLPALAAGGAVTAWPQSSTSIGILQAANDTFAQTLAIVNGAVWTMDDRFPRAEAVFVKNGRIAHVGSNKDVLALAGRARRFDAGGRTVVPGFVDTHTHFETTCQYFDSLHVDLHVPPMRTLSQMFDALRSRVAGSPEGRWIIGRSVFFFDTEIEDKRYPTREELDAISTTHPIVVLAGLHVGILNTLAFRQLGLWDPAAARALRWKDGRLRIGTDVARDAHGVPTGVVTELYDLLPTSVFTYDERRRAVMHQAVPQFVSKGYTSLLTMPFCSQDLVVDQNLQAEGLLPLRLRVHHIVPLVTSLDSIFDCALVAGQGNDLFRFGGIKLFVAGAGVDAYEHEVSDLKWAQAELNDVVYRAQCANLQVLMHEEGHASFELALNAVENAQRLRPSALRHRLEHYGELETVEEMRRVKNAGMRVTMYVPGYRDPEYRPLYATLIREGLQPVAISDATGTMQQFGPLLGIASIVAPASDGGFAPQGQAPNVEDAFRMWTTWAASAQFEEADKGSIAVGKLGDFAILNRDPRKLKGGALFDLKVDATVLGGRVVYER